MEEAQVGVRRAASHDQHDRYARAGQDLPREGLESGARSIFWAGVIRPSTSSTTASRSNLQAPAGGRAVAPRVEQVVVDAERQRFELPGKPASGDARRRVEQPREGVAAIAAQAEHRVERAHRGVRHPHRVVEDVPAVDGEDHAR